MNSIVQDIIDAQIKGNSHFWYSFIDGLSKKKKKSMISLLHEIRKS